MDQGATNATARTSRRMRGRGVARVVRAAFTLAELLVAVGVVAILTLGIGRIFASVSKLVGTGAAVGEVDNLARIIEAQMRSDFEALNRMGQAESFFAIRGRRAGDLDFDGTLDTADEVDIYLTRDDEEFDLRRNYDPYQLKSGKKSPRLSRAVSVRLDQMMFLGQASEGYRSFQAPPASEQVVATALIMWGHGLRPPVDAEDPEDRPRYRLNYPDGDFGFARGDENPFAPDDDQFSGKATGRNRFASDFVLTRRAVLLAGGLAAGEASLASASDYSPLWGDDTEVALLPRDIEASYVFGSPAAPIAGRIFGDVDEADRESASAGDGGPDGWGGLKLRPNPRLLRHGRTDILAVDRTGLQRWLEGIGVPFTSGRLGDADLTDPPPSNPGDPPILPTPLSTVRPNCRLWVPFEENTGSGLLNDKYARNLVGIQSAIAGMFHRVLVDPEPPALRVDPEDPTAPYPDPGGVYERPDPTDRRMDLHAVIASRCSSFEVAWSDGSTWERDQPLRFDRENDGVFERDIRRGDTIWFDMDFTVSDFWEENGLAQTVDERVYPRPNPDPEIGLTPDRMFDEFPSGYTRSRSHAVALGYRSNNEIDTDPDTVPAYCPKWNAVPFTPDGSAHPEQEYLAIWGFRSPEGADQGLNTASVGGYERPWPKPRLIRVRMTLHDAQNRLEGGKKFEFVFRINPDRQ